MDHDVVTIQEAGYSGQSIPDAAIFKYAVDNTRVILTFNRKHFVKLHNENPNHFGIIVCRMDRDVVSLAKKIDACLKKNLNPKNQLFRINRGSV